MLKNRPANSWFMKLLLLFSVMIVAYFVVALMLVVTGQDLKSTKGIVFGTILQNLLMFILPVLVLAMMNLKVERRPAQQTLWMGHAPSMKSILLVVLVWILALPAMNYIVEWNQNIELPQFLQGAEETLREMEDSAAETTSQLLSAQSWPVMLLMLLVVGLLPALGEEIFFRSGLLGTMRLGGVNKHVAIWVSAIIFSAIHFQFFGFVPRMLLGAWFGYLMVWSGEVWTPIIAHALNNGSIVLLTFLANQHQVNNNYVETTGAGDHWLALGSVLSTALVMFLLMRKSPSSKTKLTS